MTIEENQHSSEITDRVASALRGGAAAYFARSP
jgi:hypothetical protein